jgi:hypothetical protein
MWRTAQALKHSPSRVIAECVVKESKDIVKKHEMHTLADEDVSAWENGEWKG